jgi:hypothetical protein
MTDHPSTATPLPGEPEPKCAGRWVLTDMAEGDKSFRWEQE